MKKLNIITFILIFILNSCGNAGKVLKNEKIRTTDEFLVKQREPLTLPPDYKNVPRPETLNQNVKDSKNKIDKIIKVPERESTTKSGISVEQSILNAIKK
tara:strand:+ start:310 stop:609 length:300 start_codon:yes stop_codon:yes gene_type:complete